MVIVSDVKPQLLEQSEVILGHRYYLKDMNNTPVEDAEGLFSRVATAIAEIDKEWYGHLPVEVELLANEQIDRFTTCNLAIISHAGKWISLNSHKCSLKSLIRPKDLAN